MRFGSNKWGEVRVWETSTLMSTADLKKAKAPAVEQQHRSHQRSPQGWTETPERLRSNTESASALLFSFIY